MAHTRTMAELRFPGRILYLCDNADTMGQQLSGHNLTVTPNDLCNNVSTDEMAPSWVCFWYDNTLGHYALVGLRNQSIAPGMLQSGGFTTLVAGHSLGCGSSRETAPFGQKAAGIRLVVARSFEKIYRQNCHNMGIYTCTDFSVLAALRQNLPVPLAAVSADLDPLSCQVLRQGGLSAYNRSRMAGVIKAPALVSEPRPMTLAEKIIAGHAAPDTFESPSGAPTVQPGDSLFCHVDVRFTHDYVTAMAAAQFHAGFGAAATINDAASVYAFRDHLAFLHQVMPAAQKEQGLLHLADDLATTQRRFCQRHKIRLYDAAADSGAEAICHNAVLEDIALPGQLVIGTDSHTCTAGALGCLAFGVGSTDMANAWRSREVRVRVPASVRIELTGQLPRRCCAKDVMLSILADPYFKRGGGVGKVLEFCGSGLANWSIDERATLTNMAVEAGGMTGIIAADDVTAAYLRQMRPAPMAQGALTAVPLAADAKAHYAHKLCVALRLIQPMVATPGDPRNGVPIADLPAAVAIDLAYGGSCTGGKKSDMDFYAQILAPAAARGERVASGVQLFIQYGSQKIKRYAQDAGYADIFSRVGAQLVDPACGACIRAGPGVSTSAQQVTVAAMSRNFPGRSGPGQVYLASPLVVAASALAGRIVAPATP